MVFAGKRQELIYILQPAWPLWLHVYPKFELNKRCVLPRTTLDFPCGDNNLQSCVEQLVSSTPHIVDCTPKGILLMILALAILCELYQI